MKEFLLLIRNEPDYWEIMTAEQQQTHMQNATNYITKLANEGKIKDAQPLTMRGAMLECSEGGFKDGPFIESKEVIGGYFHILAHDLTEAIEIAKANPIFHAGSTARIEIREIMKAEGIN